MKLKWTTFSKLNKIGIIFLITTIAIMTIGLIMIGLAKFPCNINGFAVLKMYSVVYVLSKTADNLMDSKSMWLILQFGTAFATILTPLLFLITATICGCGYYTLRKKKI